MSQMWLGSVFTSLFYCIICSTNKDRIDGSGLDLAHDVCTMICQSLGQNSSLHGS